MGGGVGRRGEAGRGARWGRSGAAVAVSAEVAAESGRGAAAANVARGKCGGGECGMAAILGSESGRDVPGGAAAAPRLVGANAGATRKLGPLAPPAHFLRPPASPASLTFGRGLRTAGRRTRRHFAAAAAAAFATARHDGPARAGRAGSGPCSRGTSRGDPAAPCATPRSEGFSSLSTGHRTAGPGRPGRSAGLVGLSGAACSRGKSVRASWMRGVATGRSGGARNRRQRLAVP